MHLRHGSGQVRFHPSYHQSLRLVSTWINPILLHRQIPIAKRLLVSASILTRLPTGSSKGQSPRTPMLLLLTFLPPSALI